MDPFTIIFSAAALVVGGGAVVYTLSRRDKWRRTLSRLADENGWEFDRGSFLRNANVTGARGRRDLSVKAVNDGNNNVYTEIKIESALPGITSVRKEGIGAGLKKMFTGEDVLLGTPAFDDEVQIHGEERFLLARLDAEGRELVRAFLTEKGSVHDGAAQIRKGGYVLDYEVLATMVSQAFAISERLDPETPDDDRRLLESVEGGPTATNRLRCFQVIEDAEIREKAAARLMDDADAVNRAEGAMALRREDVLLALVREDLPDEVCGRVVGVLAAISPEAGARGLGVALETLAEGLADILEAAYSQMASSPSPGVPLSALAGVVDHHDPKVRGALAACLGLYGPAAEAPLLTLLADESDDVAAAAATALTDAGTLAAVHPLMQRSDGVMRATALKKAARGAITAIQGRHGGGARGGLALTQEAEGGELELVDED